MAGLGPGDFFGEMTLIEMKNRSATVVAESPTVLYELTARNLYAYYKADIHAYVMLAVYGGPAFAARPLARSYRPFLPERYL